MSAVAAALLAPWLTGANSTPAHAADNFRDYASDAFSNPWDYNDEADMVLGDGPMLNIGNPSISGGQVHFDANPASYISPLWGGYPGALNGILDGAARPIDTSAYRRIAFKLTSTAPAGAGIRWYTCADGGVADSCQGGFSFDIQPGTNVYDFELKTNPLDPALATQWSGKVTGLRLAFAGGAHIDLDWMSVYAGNTPTEEASGPAAKVLTPDIEGGESLGPLLRGKNWDMSDPSDISRTYNVAGSISGGSFNGTNAPPTMNDPTVVMNLGCKTFKAADYHHFTVDLTYEGVFNVEDRAGGGMNQRVIWRIAGTPLDNAGRDLQNSDDIVIYPGRWRYSIDLATNPASKITDALQTAPRLGWTGEIEHLRVDPNEDHGARRWKVREVKLAADVTSAPGAAFKILWKDANYRPGGTATIAMSQSPDGSGAVPIASNVPVNTGTNTTTWTAANSGRWWVVLTINRNGAESTSVSTGPVLIAKAPAHTFGINERGKDGTLAQGDRCPGSASAGPVKAAPTTSATGKKTTKKVVRTTKKKR